MKRLINATTIVAMALYMVPPFAAQAQTPQTAMVGDQEVICLPNKKAMASCPDGKLCVVAKNPAKCQSNAEKAVAEAAVANGTATDEQKAIAQAATETPPTDQAAADKAAADQTAADQAAAADKAAADQAAADKAAADQAAADKAAADQAAADKAAADQAAADKAAADQAAADKAAADKAAAADQSSADANPGRSTEIPPEIVAAFPTVNVNGTEVICLPAKTDICPEGATCVVAAKIARCQTQAEKKLADKAVQAGKNSVDQLAMDKAAIAAAKKAQKEAAAAAANDPNIKPVEAPVPDQQAVQTLQNVLNTQTGTDPTVQAETPPVAAEVTADPNTPPADQPVPKDATVTTETVTEADTRSSAQDFAAAPVEVAPGKKSGLSTLEKVGLVALGALVIGTMINNGKQQVVQNTGDRVVVRQDDGSYQIYKDDNALLREPGSTVTTQTFGDGSTRTIVKRTDGSQISTIRDASGRVLQRVSYDPSGHPTVLIDDLKPEQKVDVKRLPTPRAETNRISVDNNDAQMRAALAAAQADDLGQKFSLRQIRTIPQIRYIAPTIDVNNVTFETGSAAIQPTEARKLNKLGTFIGNLIRKNPNEVFLIEGHTDAVGSAASNLALSDRRAESVAKALTEYFGVPPENLVVQGYGESELLIDSQGDERLNRRVAVRIITSLLRQ